MDRRWLAGSMALLTACGGRMQVDAHPAGPAPGLPPAAAPPAAAATPPSVTALPSPSGDTAATLQLKLAADSAADAVALDSLAKVTPSASQP